MEIKNMEDVRDVLIEEIKGLRDKTLDAPKCPECGGDEYTDQGSAFLGTIRMKPCPKCGKGEG